MAYLATLVALVAGFLASTSVQPAGAESPYEYGYWTKTQTPGSPNPSIPVPPTVPVAPPEQVVPAGGLYVALAARTSQPDPTQSPSPTEPSAVSALRFLVEPGSEVDLSLVVAEGQDADGPSQNPTPAMQIDACIVDLNEVSWDVPDGPGRWDDHPFWDCDSMSTPGLLEEDGQRIVWHLSSSFEVSDGVIDVVLVPRGLQDPNNPANTQQVPFQLAFEPPDQGTLDVLSTPYVDNGDEGGGGDFTFDGFGSDDYTDEFSFGSTDTDYTGVDSTSGDNGTPVATGKTGGTRPFRNLGKSPLPLDNRFDRIMAVTLLFLIGLALWWVAGTPMRAPRLLGSLGAGSIPTSDNKPLGGVGRFARVRSGRPPKL